MKKRVNIYPRGPITSVNPPIRMAVKGVTKDVQDIRKCIIAGAKVEEVINNGTAVLLNLNNYDKDNGGGNLMPTNVKFDAAVAPIPEQEEIKDYIPQAPAKKHDPVVIKTEPKQATPSYEVPDADKLEAMDVDELLGDSDVKEEGPVAAPAADEDKEETPKAEEKPAEAPRRNYGKIYKPLAKTEE